MTSIITTAVPPFSYNLATLQELLTTNSPHNSRIATEDSTDTLYRNVSEVNQFSQTVQEYHSCDRARSSALREAPIANHDGAAHQTQRRAQQPKQYTDHAWKSYSFDEFLSPHQGESDGRNNETTSSSISSPSSYPPSSSTIREDHDLMFPEKLHLMLRECSECHSTSHIVSWRQHGRAFRVHKPREFVRAILPKYFRQSKMTSFQRQLNLYGFKRLTAGDDKGSYYHELFLRGRLRLSQYIRRTRIKGIGTKQKASPQFEPNFACMVPCKENDLKCTTSEFVPQHQNYYHGEAVNNSEERQPSFNSSLPLSAQDQLSSGHHTKTSQEQSFYMQPQQDDIRIRNGGTHNQRMDVPSSSTHHSQHHFQTRIQKSPLSVSSFPEQMGELRRSFLGSNDSPRDLPLRDMRTQNQYSNPNHAKGMWYNLSSAGQKVVNEDMQLFSSTQGEVGDDFVW